MNNLETYEIHEIITQNVIQFDEWYDYVSNELNTSGDDLMRQLKYIEDASYLRDLYYNFFDSYYNSYVEDSD
jgi:hypothetical protein